MQVPNHEALYKTLDAGFPFTATVLQYNVDQAMREEGYPETKWVNRMERVKRLIDEVDADIVCLQEMRQLPDSPTVNRFLGSFTQYRYTVAYRNPGAASFGNAILYKPEKWFPVESVVRWLTGEHVNDTKKPGDAWATKSAGSCGYGYIVMGVRLLPVVDGRIAQPSPALWVFNTHFGLEEDLKTRSCRMLRAIVNDVALDELFIVCGDFNFFPDRDGGKQRAILSEVWNDLGDGAVTCRGRRVEGTFVGYERDAFKADLNNMVSRLDHVFSHRQLVVNSTPLLYTKTMLEKEPEELTTRSYPSDHLPLVVSIIQDFPVDMAL